MYYQFKYNYNISKDILFSLEKEDIVNHNDYIPIKYDKKYLIFAKVIDKDKISFKLHKIISSREVNDNRNNWEFLTNLDYEIIYDKDIKGMVKWMDKTLFMYKNDVYENDDNDDSNYEFFLRIKTEKY